MSLWVLTVCAIFFFFRWVVLVLRKAPLSHVCSLPKSTCWSWCCTVATSWTQEAASPAASRQTSTPSALPFRQWWGSITRRHWAASPSAWCPALPSALKPSHWCPSEIQPLYLSLTISLLHFVSPFSPFFPLLPIPAPFPFFYLFLSRHVCKHRTCRNAKIKHSNECYKSI